jgi:hypothetical protein
MQRCDWRRDAPVTQDGNTMTIFDIALDHQRHRDALRTRSRCDSARATSSFGLPAVLYAPAPVHATAPAPEKTEIFYIDDFRDSFGDTPLSLANDEAQLDLF